MREDFALLEHRSTTQLPTLWGARVWDAREQLDSGGLSDATYVIKDTWTNMNKRREEDVYDILYGLKHPEREESALKRVLFTPVRTEHLPCP